MKSVRTSLIAVSRIVAVAAFANLASVGLAVDLYTDSFSGGTGLIDGVLVEGGANQTGDVAWSANASFLADGTIDGSVEGSAILPFQPLINATYELSVDITASERLFVLGFTENPLLSPGLDRQQDRILQNGGMAWMFIRNTPTEPNAVATFTGPDTAGQELIDIVANGIDVSATNNLKIIIDTTGDGSSFNATWQINGSTVRDAVVPISIYDINYVAMSNDDVTANIAIYDNFLLTGPATIPGDVNRDGNIDGIDFGIIRGNLFLSDLFRADGDLTGDGIVDFADYRQWKDAAGPEMASLYSLNAVPEPATSLLVALVLSSAFGLRCRG